ncbi:hypothetical protein [Pseudalkalibacillus caeni]|uniref:Uncharacterized protein n=1 Tax=Exobacillus caeni TaxID=2574798 RepID=A0A5R9FHR3_9BACL|nr:hypothetical protein [Pseudalkalibacillus caeni]TLS39115.1 hypothetical protein FCL54_02040 [Pseudalkalibacillus caeni]
MIRRIVLSATLACILLSGASTGYATDLKNSFSFKMSVVNNGKEHEWEYNSPVDYEYENGDRVIKDQRALKEIENLYQRLNINEMTKVEEVVSILQRDGFNQLERVEIRWINSEGRLFTWNWVDNGR